MNRHNNRGNPPKEVYDIGYRKPPKATRFKKGQSGNPKGRPKKKRNQGVDIAEILEQPVKVKVDGTTTQMQAYEAALRQLKKKALQDHDVRALCDLIKNFDEHGLFKARETQQLNGVIQAPDGVSVVDYIRALSDAAHETEL